MQSCSAFSAYPCDSSLKRSTNGRLPNTPMRIFTAVITSVALLFLLPQVRAAEPEVLVLSASEDAGGTTQADLDMQVLKMLERRSVAMLEAKMRDYLRAQGQQTQIPKLDAESHYIESGAMKLAIVRVRSPKVVNQVYVYGVKGKVFHRVACTRMKDFDQAAPLFYGPCSDKIREVFGVSISPR